MIVKIDNYRYMNRIWTLRQHAATTAKKKLGFQHASVGTQIHHDRQNFNLVTSLHLLQHVCYEWTVAGCVCNNFELTVETDRREFACAHMYCRLRTTQMIWKLQTQFYWLWNEAAMLPCKDCDIVIRVASSYIRPECKIHFYNHVNRNDFHNVFMISEWFNFRQTILLLNSTKLDQTLTVKN